MRIVVLLLSFVLLCVDPHLRVPTDARSISTLDGTTVCSRQENSSPSLAGDYLIGIGDSLDVSVERRPELSWRGQVNSEGDINSLPFLPKSVRVLCLT